MSVALRLERVLVRAGGEAILGPLDLEVPAREYALLVGPSGSGKSTLLRAIAGLAVPEEGKVELFGTPASRDGKLLTPPAERGVGFLFQGGALWPHMSVGKMLSFALDCAGVARGQRKARVGELLEQVELAGYEKRMPGTLSGGEAQRLALARTLASSPRVLLLDEPLGPLDVELRGQLMRMLTELHGRLGWTTLHVTHDPEEADGVATRTVRLRDGVIERESRCEQETT